MTESEKHVNLRGSGDRENSVTDPEPNRHRVARGQSNFEVSAAAARAADEGSAAGSQLTRSEGNRAFVLGT